MKTTRGGKREGAGRPSGSGQGRTVTTSSINLPPELWSRLDALRGELTRSAWIAAKIKNARILFSSERNSAGTEASFGQR